MTMFAVVNAILAVSLAADTPSIVIEQDNSGAPVNVADLGQQSAAAAKVRPSVQNEQREILEKLRVQSALRSAHEALNNRQYSAAITQLEPFLDLASTTPDLLSTLESAYRGRISELLADGASGQAAIVAERLRILSNEMIQPTGAAKQSPIQEVTQAAAQEVEAVTKPLVARRVFPQTEVTPEDEPKPTTAFGRVGKQMAASGKQMAASVKSLIPRAITGESKETAEPKTIEARGKMDDSESLTQSIDAPAALQQALKLFQDKRYPEALVAFEEAGKTDPGLLRGQQPRWGYCLLFVTIDRYNELLDQNPDSIDPSVWRELKRDAENARRLAPKISYCDTVVSSIDERLKASLAHVQSAPAVVTNAKATQAYGHSREAVAQPVAFKHHVGMQQNWSVTETANFVIYHRNPALAEEVAQLSERARTASQDQWFRDEASPDWEPKCHMYLYPTGQEYSMATNVGPESPGHSSVVNNSGQIQRREVHLRADDPTMKYAVLPHEVTHVVLAGRFGTHSLPRWADEGMAVLTEPVDKQDAHLANLARTHAMGRAYTCGQVMTMAQYPAGDRMRDFYAHSVGICRCLVERHGHEKLVQFLRLSLDTGNYEQALNQIYGMNSFTELEREFRGFVGTIGSAPATFAGR